MGIADTIEARIRQLARETGAPETFIEQVRNLFTTKGISLAEDSTPYVGALQEAFRREERIRKDTLVARENLGRLQQHFRHVGSTYRRQVDRLRKVQRTLEEARGGKRRRRRSAVAGASASSASSSSSASSKGFVTRVQRDDLPMVPGPDEVQ